MKSTMSLALLLVGACGVFEATARAQANVVEPTLAKETSVKAAANQDEERAKAKAAAQATPFDYKVGAGDVLQISVWKEPDASAPSVIVRPDGKISMPLLKDVEVVGMTPTQIEQLITEKLSKLISEPDVTVVVTGTHSQKIYAVGAVKHEGPIAYTYRMSIMQAISEAGGLTEYAKKKKIYILRTENGKESKLPFNYDAAIKGENSEGNIRLVPGDTLVVP
jgi:polysaccharide biosynthesis/export protein